MQFPKIKRWLSRRGRLSATPYSSSKRWEKKGGKSRPNGPQRVERLTCPSQMEAVQQVLTWLEDLQLDLTAAVLWECRIILVEAFTNAVCHAHKNQGQPLSVGLIIEVWTDWLEIQVWDSGAPFDFPRMLEAMRQQNEAEPLRYGSGRGLLLMEQVSDRLAYERRGDRNCLVARKKIIRR